MFAAGLIPWVPFQYICQVSYQTSICSTATKIAAKFQKVYEDFVLNPTGSTLCDILKWDVLLDIQTGSWLTSKMCTVLYEYIIFIRNNQQYNKGITLRHSRFDESGVIHGLIVPESK